jgi:hypothetical protein
MLSSVFDGTNPIGIASAGWPVALNEHVFSVIPFAASIWANGFASAAGRRFAGERVVGITITSTEEKMSSYRSLIFRMMFTAFG